LDTACQAAARIAAGLDPRFIDQYHAALASTTAEQVNTAWCANICPEDVTIAIGGPATFLEAGLQAAGIQATLIR